MTDTPTKTDLLPDVLTRLLKYALHEAKHEQDLFANDDYALLEEALTTRTQPTADIEGLDEAIDAIANDGAREILDKDGHRVGVSSGALEVVLRAARLYQASQKGAVEEVENLRTEILALINGQPESLKCSTFLGKNFQYWIDLENANRVSGADAGICQKCGIDDDGFPVCSCLIPTKEDALSALDMIFQIFASHCENMDVDMPDDEDEALLEGCKAEIRTRLADQKEG